METGKRSTGKTFRSLLQALILASEGEYVFYATEKSHLAQFYFTNAVRIATAYLDPAFLVINKAQKTLEIGHGVILFEPKDPARLSGIPWKYVYDD